MPSPLLSSEPTASAFELTAVALRFPGAERAVLEDLSLDVRKTEFLSIVGPSGCGKSTLLKLLAGLLAPTNGSVIRRGDPGATDRIGFVFQYPTLLPWRTAAGNLRLPLELGRMKPRTQLSVGECHELLKQVGLSVSDAQKRPSELSGGMQMRLSLARALATQPEVLLLDEPFAAVDDMLRLRLQEDVCRLHGVHRLTTILVTHNLQEAVFLSDRVVVLGGAPSRVIQTISCSTPHERNAEYRQSSEFFEILRNVSAVVFGAPRVIQEESHA